MPGGVKKQKMKRLWSAVAGLFLLIAIPVNASSVVFTFTGHVNSEAINGCGVLVKCGMVTGSYTFDSAAPDLNPDPVAGLYAATSITFLIDGVLFFSSANAVINVANFSLVHQYGLLAAGTVANLGTAVLSVLLADPSAKAFGSDGLIQNPSALVKLLPGTFQLNADDDTFQLLGTIDTISPYVPPGAGLLQICNVAGAGVAVGTNVTFSVNETPVTVPAGSAPGGSCSPLMVEAAGAVGITTTIPPGMLPTAVSTLPNTEVLISSNLPTGAATVTVNAGALTTVTFTNTLIANTAVLQICNVAGGGIGVGTTFTFSVSGTPVTVPAGSAPGGTCSPLMAAPPGNVGITAILPPGTALSDVSTLPDAGLLVSSNLPTGTATVKVSIGGQTTVTFIGTGTDSFQVRYASHLEIGDAVINLTNTGTGTLTVPTGLGSLTRTGNICANVYTYDANEELISCCACLVTPNGLNSLSAKTDLVSNTLTPGVPTSIVINLIASTPLGLSTTGSGGTCDPSSPTATAGPGGAGSLAPGLLAWGTTIHALPTIPVTYGVTEDRFEPAPLSAAELTKLTTFCGFIQANGGGYGICKSCRTGGLGAVSK